MRSDLGKILGSILLGSRWAMAPYCLGLAAALAIDLVEFCREATPILQRNVYGRFERVGRGTYALTEAGRAGLVRFADAVATLAFTEAAA